MFRTPRQALLEKLGAASIRSTAGGLGLPCGSTQPAELDLTLGTSRVGGIIGSVAVHESTNVGTLSVFDCCTEVCQTQTSSTLPFQPVRVVLVTEHMALKGGTGGASLNDFKAIFNWCALCV